MEFKIELGCSSVATQIACVFLFSMSFQLMALIIDLSNFFSAYLTLYHFLYFMFEFMMNGGGGISLKKKIADESRESSTRYI